jgi:hypothetical protein
MPQHFRPLGGLTHWLRAIACLVGIIVVCNIAIDLYVSHLLREIRDGAVDSPSLLTWGMQGAHRLQVALDIGYGALMLVNIVLFCCWLHRAASNVVALGAHGLESSPGWTIGWFFVPVANLVMPYRAMREVWQASRAPAQWATARVGPALLTWWVLQVLSSFLGRVKSVMLHDAHTVDEVLRASTLEVVTLLIFLCATLLFVYLTGSLYNLQEATRNAQTPAIPPLPAAVAG